MPEDEARKEGRRRHILGFIKTAAGKAHARAVWKLLDADEKAASSPPPEKPTPERKE